MRLIVLTKLSYLTKRTLCFSESINWLTTTTDLTLKVIYWYTNKFLSRPDAYLSRMKYAATTQMSRARTSIIITVAEHFATTKALRITYLLILYQD